MSPLPWRGHDFEFTIGEDEVVEDRLSIMVFEAERSPEDWIIQTADNSDIIPGMETNAVRQGTVGAVDY